MTVMGTEFQAVAAELPICRHLMMSLSVREAETVEIKAETIDWA